MTSIFSPQVPPQENYKGASARHHSDSLYLYGDERFESAHEHAHFCLENIMKEAVYFNANNRTHRKNGHDLLFLADLLVKGQSSSRLSDLFMTEPSTANLFGEIDSAWQVHLRYHEKYFGPDDHKYIKKYWELRAWIKTKLSI